MTDDLVQRLREYNQQCAYSSLINPDGYEAANRIEAQATEIERLKVQLSVETEPSPYCPICGSCGDEGCCGSKRCLYPAAEWRAGWRAGYEDGVQACVWALEADAKLCDCAALEANECACGAWDDYKTITSDRAIEIVRALQEQSK
jgi:hypothetical protein